MKRIHVFLLECVADDEMVDTVDYLMEDNDRWISPEIEKDLLAGKLQGGARLVGTIPASGEYDVLLPTDALCEVSLDGSDRAERLDQRSTRPGQITALLTRAALTS